MPKYKGLSYNEQKSVKAIVKKALKAEIETKFRQYNFSATNLTSTFAHIPNDSAIAGDNQPCYIAQGTANGARIGNRIKAKYLELDFMVNKTNNSTGTGYCRFQVLRIRDRATLLPTGSSAYDHVDTDLFDVLGEFWVGIDSPTIDIAGTGVWAKFTHVRKTFNLHGEAFEYNDATARPSGKEIIIVGISSATNNFQVTGNYRMYYTDA